MTNTPPIWHSALKEREPLIPAEIKTPCIVAVIVPALIGAATRTSSGSGESASANRQPSAAGTEAMRFANKALRLENATANPVPKGTAPPRSQLPGVRDGFAKLASVATRCNTARTLVSPRHAGGWTGEGPAGDGEWVRNLVLPFQPGIADDRATGTPRYPDVPRIAVNDVLSIAGPCQ